MLQLIDLHIGYGNKVIQRNLNLKAQQGRFICLLGTNGCGKSTLLRTLAGLQPALSGRVLIDETDISTLSNEQRAQRLSVVLTDKVEIDNATISEIVAMGRYPYTSFLGRLTKHDEQIIADSLQQVMMQGREAEFFNAISDGEKQRVVIAKALAQSTDLIMLDEPTAHLDVPNRIKTMLLLQQLAHTQHKCIICSSHDLDLALQTADEIWLMIPRQGGIIVGSPHELLQQGQIQTAFADNAYQLIESNDSLRISFTGK